MYVRYVHKKFMIYLLNFRIYLCSLSLCSTTLVAVLKMNTVPSDEPTETYSPLLLNAARFQSHPTWKSSSLETKINHLWTKKYSFLNVKYTNLIKERKNSSNKFRVPRTKSRSRRLDCYSNQKKKEIHKGDAYVVRETVTNQ